MTNTEMDKNDNLYNRYLFDMQKNDENGIKVFETFLKEEEYIFECHEKYTQGWWDILERCNKIRNIFKIN